MNKTVAVLGADGRSGRVCVNALLSAGYIVRAGVRSGTLKERQNLSQHKFDATKLSDVRALVKGSSVIVSLIGHGKNSPKDLQTTAIKNILKATKSGKNIRIISLTGTGVRQPGDTISLIDKILNFSIKLIDPDRISDGIEHANVLRNSSADWSIVRVLKLTNGSHLGEPVLTLGGPAEVFTPRARVAAAIVDIIKNDSFHRQSPVVSGAKIL
jgi:hypothetical protein